jgi:predicted dehydrogenase
MQQITRRRLLKKSAGSAVVAAGTIALAKPTYAKLGKNEEIQIGVMGFNGRGKSHIDEHQKAEGVNVTALCDVDERIWGDGQKRLENAGGSTPAFYHDIRKMLENKSLDAISIATCNHWHALGTIWACQAGKDVYVEKPASHHFTEGRKMVEAARKYNRIVQHGTQSRSSEGYRDAIARIHAGEIGKVYMAKGLCYKTSGGRGTRGNIGWAKTEPAPKGLHFDTWLGPAPTQPFHTNIVHYRWHWFWDFGNGDMGNQGVHELDKARWGLNKNEFPVQITAFGGRHTGPKDQGETPNILTCAYVYEDGAQLVFETRGLTSNEEAGEKIGNIFYGSDGPEGVEGWMTLGERKAHLRDPKQTATLELEPVGGNGNPNIFGNFHDAMRSRKVEDLNADVLEGHYSAGTIHLGNIAFRLGRTLHFDPKTERFINDNEANAMLTRKPRPPFNVPDEV